MAADLWKLQAVSQTKLDGLLLGWARRHRWPRKIRLRNNGLHNPPSFTLFLGRNFRFTKHVNGPFLRPARRPARSALYSTDSFWSLRFFATVPAFVTVSKRPVGRLQKDPVVARRRNTDPGQSPAPRVHLAQSDGSTRHRHPSLNQSTLNTCLDSRSGSYQPTTTNLRGRAVEK
jgi:hypothetical protein